MMILSIFFILKMILNAFLEINLIFLFSFCDIDTMVV